MYRKLAIDHGRLVRLAGRGLSDQAIARVLGCSRYAISYRRHALGIPSRYRCFTERRAQEAELDRLWGRLSLDEKVMLLARSDSAQSAQSVERK